ncbi:type III polyketide synthase [Roseomonas sp. HF4]|uniref:type III polyketide synthase n=1 Tax=Roseomonas sp. HF4 TaxID=2562313 RepID=UPI0010BFBA04|nr:type III polyketide synthase [Roseomonas sp. HF4]
MQSVYINRIACAVPPNQVHEAFSIFAGRQVLQGRDSTTFARMAARSQIQSRWSVLTPSEPLGSGTACGFYQWGGAFPSTKTRMQRYEAAAPALAEAALDALGLGEEAPRVTHIVFASCTGFAAPGLDHWIINRYGIRGSVERSIIGFMGCQAAINALKFAWHIVRSDPGARVLVVCLELCTLHLQQTSAIEQLLSFLIFADGCATALVSAEPGGLRVDGFHAGLVPQAADQITWRIGDAGFDMTLSGLVPFTLAHALPEWRHEILGGADTSEIDLWAVHPGGRSILDAVAHGLDLPADALDESRAVLQENGNMSSATVMFVLRDMMARAQPGQRGCAMAFGPGLSAETMRFVCA